MMELCKRQIHFHTHIHTVMTFYAIDLSIDFCLCSYICVCIRRLLTYQMHWTEPNKYYWKYFVRAWKPVCGIWCWPMHINRQLNYPKVEQMSERERETERKRKRKKQSWKWSVASLNTWYQYYSLTQHFEIVRYSMCMSLWVSGHRFQKKHSGRERKRKKRALLFMGMQYAHTEIAISCAIAICFCNSMLVLNTGTHTHTIIRIHTVKLLLWPTDVFDNNMCRQWVHR